MARPTLPARGITGWDGTVNAAINDVSDRADQALAATAASPPVLRRFSEFAGANDDVKLAAFMSYAAAQTYHGITCMFDEVRTYNFTTPVTIYSGFSIAGPGRQVDQGRSSLPIPNKVNLSMSGGWLRLPNGTIFGININGVSFDGSSTARVFEPNSSCVMWTSTFRDISMQNLASFIGSLATNQPCDFVCMDGFWNVNNIRETAWHVGGSDCFFKPTGMNLDSPAANMPVGNYLAMFDAFGVADVSGIYITAEQHSGILIQSTNAGMLRIHNCVVEGRNAGAPCYGALIRISNGDVQLRDNITHYAMSNPAGSGHTDKGAIHITGGNVQILGCQYRLATGVAESVPYIYVGGGKVRVRDISTSGTWTGKPVVAVSTAGGGSADVDNSVTMTTVA